LKLVIRFCRHAFASWLPQSGQPVFVEVQTAFLNLPIPSPGSSNNLMFIENPNILISSD
jgi:hypothetical protein